jgi:hypothetical protein
MSKSKDVSRRTILAGAAAMPATAAVAASALATTEPDPIFAAIEQCRAALGTYSAAVKAEGETESALVDELRARGGVENPLANRQPRPSLDRGRGSDKPGIRRHR